MIRRVSFFNEDEWPDISLNRTQLTFQHSHTLGYAYLIVTDGKLIECVLFGN